MGTCSKESCSNIRSQSYQDLRFSKKILDNVHGNIHLDPLYLKFVDTEQFQRLRDLKQLGQVYMVYPGAVHSRFEHSLGVYFLAGKTIHMLNDRQGAELSIEDFDMKTVKLAGLLHDVGHGPFSHLFEREFLPRVGVYKWSHEEMTLKMIDSIVDMHHIDIDAELLKKAKAMIVGSTKNALPKSTNGKQFLYDIVANGRNGIDVDKFDYIVRDSQGCGLGCRFKYERLMDSMRVLDDEICYRANDYLTVYDLFDARADLHRKAYTHAKVKAVELMVVDALSKANDYLGISSSIQDPAEFWKLDDSILKAIETDSRQELKEARDIILRIKRRELYQFCNEFIVPRDWLERFKEVTPQDIVCSQSGGATIKEEDIAVSTVKIDLTCEGNNPLRRTNFFQDYESDEKFPIDEKLISNRLPDFFLDRIVRVYSKNPDLVEAVSEAFENLQLKTFGRKMQVHKTPNKKKCRRQLIYSSDSQHSTVTTL